jgi:hypothetical protein
MRGKTTQNIKHAHLNAAKFNHDLLKYPKTHAEAGSNKLVCLGQISPEIPLND